MKARHARRRGRALGYDLLRVLPPAETLRHVLRFLPVLGITRVANVTGLDRVGVPIVSVYRPNSRSISVFHGKGPDLDLARISGVMEAVEAYHAETITAPLKLASYEELRYTHDIIDVDRLPLRRGHFFNSQQQLLWIESIDLRCDRGVWVPYTLVHQNSTLQPLPGERPFRSTSTGLAAGNSTVEATVHALCEAIERDAATLWRLRPESYQNITRIDPDSVDDNVCIRMFEQIRAAGLYFAAWDATSDIGVPVIMCQVFEPVDAPYVPYHLATGSACHPTRHVALRNAVTEALQARLTLIVGARDDIEEKWYRTSARKRALKHCEAMQRHAPTRRFETIPSQHSADIDQVLDWLIDRLTQCGLERVFLVNLSRREFPWSVVKVIVPGLEDGEDAADYRPDHRARSILSRRQ